MALAPMRHPCPTTTAPHSTAPGATWLARPMRASCSTTAALLMMTCSSIVAPALITAPGPTNTPLPITASMLTMDIG
ncbi:hypothetical protein AY599_21625 [Leptolyngbya valderiana BDU 20041]|nr:hypothetical protein AY599_21625 [Leptolyngbya valderiana BDU 20041]